jgi:transcriptional regulator with XRE-family HTH domain
MKKSHAVVLEELKEVIEGSRPLGTPLYMNGKMGLLAVMIKNHKVREGISTRKFAEKAGVGRSTIENYAKKSGMRAEQFIKIAKALGRKPVDLFEMLGKGHKAVRSELDKPAPSEPAQHTTRQYIVVENFQPGLDLVATEFQLVPAAQRDQ